jgi:hypothetical protein
MCSTYHLYPYGVSMNVDEEHNNTMQKRIDGALVQLLGTIIDTETDTIAVVSSLLGLALAISRHLPEPEQRKGVAASLLDAAFRLGVDLH